MRVQSFFASNSSSYDIRPSTHAIKPAIWTNQSVCIRVWSSASLCSDQTSTEVKLQSKNELRSSRKTPQRMWPASRQVSVRQIFEAPSKALLDSRILSKQTYSAGRKVRWRVPDAGFVPGQGWIFRQVFLFRTRLKHPVYCRQLWTIQKRPNTIEEGTSHWLGARNFKSQLPQPELVCMLGKLRHRMNIIDNHSTPGHVELIQIGPTVLDQLICNTFSLFCSIELNTSRCR